MAQAPRSHDQWPEQPTWLPGLLGGNAEATDAFCRQQHPVVYRLCLGFLACTAEAEDAAQDAMLRLLDRIARYDPSYAFEVWRNSVVLNLCRDRLRYLARQRAVDTRAGVDQAVDQVALPDQELSRREQRAVLERSLRALPPREREALVLRDLEGLTTADVAASMSVTQGTVRSLVTLARRRLRHLLRPCEGVDGLTTCTRQERSNG